MTDLPTPAIPGIQRLAETFDWASSPVGPRSDWPVSLRLMFDFLLAAPNQIVLFWGPDYIALYNDAYAPTIGNKHPAAFGQPAARYWSELWDDLEPLLARVRDAREPVFAKDRPFYIERFGYPEIVTFDISYSPVFEEDGSVGGVLCLVSETTERTQFERRLLASEGQLKAITNSIDQMIWSTRPDGFHDYFNERWYEFTGLEPGSTDGDGWAEVFHPDDRERAWAVWRESLESGRPYHIEYRLRHHSGGYRWVIGRANCVRDAEGKISRWYGTCTDIHELKVAEIERSAIIALQEEIRSLDEPADIALAAARMLGEMIGASRAGYGTIDPVTETVMIEKDWTAPGIRSMSGEVRLRDYGSFVDDLKEGRVVIFSDASRDPRTADKAEALREVGAVSLVNIPIRERTGLVALLFINCATVRDWNAHELRFIDEIAERTRQAVERKRAEKELQALTQSLERQVAERTAALLKSESQLRQSQKMEAVGQLTGGIAHDFNNNLAVVISGLNLLRRKLDRGETDVGRFIEGAMEGAQRAAALTQRLLAFSRQQPLLPEILKCNELVAAMTDLLSRSLGEHIQIETALSPDLWDISADRSQLENVVINLAVNARDAMPDGGTLTIATRNAPLRPGEPAPASLPPDDYVCLSIIDGGTGMTPEVLARAFEPFFTTKDVGKGTGLGLSQVFGFVRQSGGSVDIASTPGVGTRVDIYLPRHRGAERERPDEGSRPAPVDGGRGEHVLVVEDEERVRAFSLEALRELGYRVTAATNGQEALQLLKDGLDVDLVFTDIVMPRMNGLRLAEEVAILRPGMRVLFTTGYARDGLSETGREPGLVIRKPFSMEDLGAKIREALDCPSAARQTA